METISNSTQKSEQYDLGTKVWSTICHNCGVCKFANKKPKSTFGKVMDWHRTWCPGWAANTKVYGLKPLS